MVMNTNISVNMTGAIGLFIGWPDTAVGLAAALAVRFAVSLVAGLAAGSPVGAVVGLAVGLAVQNAVGLAVGFAVETYPKHPTMWSKAPRPMGIETRWLLVSCRAMVGKGRVMCAGE